MAVLEVRPVSNLLGTSLSYASAVKAGPWIFLTGHEAFDFAAGVTEAVAGPPGFPLLRRPRWRREGDFIFQRMQRILQELGSDLSHGVRLDQHYPTPAAVDPYHRARRGVRRLHSAKHVGRHGALLWGGRRHLLVSDRRSARQRIRSSENLSEGCHCIGQLGVCADDCLQRVCVCRRAHGEWTGTRTGSAGACS